MSQGSVYVFRPPTYIAPYNYVLYISVEIRNQDISRRERPLMTSHIRKGRGVQIQKYFYRAKLKMKHSFPIKSLVKPFRFKINFELIFLFLPQMKMK